MSDQQKGERETKVFATWLALVIFFPFVFVFVVIFGACSYVLMGGGSTGLIMALVLPVALLWLAWALIRSLRE